MTIKEGNIIIAKFLGYMISEWTYEDGSRGALMHTNKHDFEEMRFNYSWDALIPALQKWDRLTDVIFQNEYEELSDRLDRLVTMYELQPVFECLIECIQWYNQIKKS